VLVLVVFGWLDKKIVVVVVVVVYDGMHGLDHESSSPTRPPYVPVQRRLLILSDIVVHLLPLEPLLVVVVLVIVLDLHSCPRQLVALPTRRRGGGSGGGGGGRLGLGALGRPLRSQSSDVHQRQGGVHLRRRWRHLGSGG
jgi:hypothetical protein